MFVDANIFIIASLGSDNNSKKCREFLARVEKGEQHAITSVLVLHEILRSIEMRTKSREKASAKTARFASLPNLRICEVTNKHFTDSLKYFKQGIEPRDALHVAVMLDNSVDKILSFDRDFDAVGEIKRQEP